MSLWIWKRSIAPGGAVQYAGANFRLVAVMSRSRIVGRRMVFGRMVSEIDHVPRPASWRLFEGVPEGSPDRLVRSGIRTLAQAKAAAERLADDEARDWARAQATP